MIVEKAIALYPSTANANSILAGGVAQQVQQYDCFASYI